MRGGHGNMLEEQVADLGKGKSVSAVTLNLEMYLTSGKQTQAASMSGI
jgi:hypothetical protein